MTGRAAAHTRRAAVCRGKSFHYLDHVDEDLLLDLDAGVVAREEFAHRRHHARLEALEVDAAPSRKTDTAPRVHRARQGQVWVWSARECAAAARSRSSAWVVIFLLPSAAAVTTHLAWSNEPKNEST